MSIKRVSLVGLQASTQASHVFFLKEIQISITGNNCWKHSFPNGLDFFCLTKRRPKCLCLSEIQHQHCQPPPSHPQRKAPSMTHCSDLSTPLRFNARKKAKSSSQRACFKSSRATNRTGEAEKATSHRTQKQDLLSLTFCLLVLVFVQINFKTRLISLQKR